MILCHVRLPHFSLRSSFFFFHAFSHNSCCFCCIDKTISLCKDSPQQTHNDAIQSQACLMNELGLSSSKQAFPKSFVFPRNTSQCLKITQRKFMKNETSWGFSTAMSTIRKRGRKGHKKWQAWQLSYYNLAPFEST